MTSVYAIMVVMIRLWAASYVIGALQWAPSSAVMAFGNSDGTVEPYAVASLVGQFMWILVGSVAWFVAPWLARRIYPMGANSPISSSVDATSLVAIGSFLIGIFYLGQYAIPLLVDWGGWLAERMGETPIEEGQLGTLRYNTNIRDWSDLISNILIVIVACVMTFRPSYLARIFRWLQSTGHYKKGEEKS
ncbi:MAG: hypothetical protein AAF936_03410 [Pseudomonadota bacterium]